MARRQARPAAPREYRLEPYQRRCPACGGTARVAYHDARTVATLDGLSRLTLVVRRCQDPACPPYRRPYRPEEGGGWALPLVRRRRRRHDFQPCHRALLFPGTLVASAGHTPSATTICPNCNRGGLGGRAERLLAAGRCLRRWLRRGIVGR